jgi:hypothetical protein
MPPSATSLLDALLHLLAIQRICASNSKDCALPRGKAVPDPFTVIIYHPTSVQVSVGALQGATMSRDCTLKNKYDFDLELSL